jgi:hypothetical protein
MEEEKGKAVGQAQDAALDSHNLTITYCIDIMHLPLLVCVLRVLTCLSCCMGGAAGNTPFEAAKPHSITNSSKKWTIRRRSTSMVSIQ